VKILALDLEGRRIAFNSDRDFFFREPVLPGSLVKPIALLAIERAQLGGAGGRVVCPPSDSRVPSVLSCWDHRGHGSIDRSQALAYSCNRFFVERGAEVPPEIFASTLAAVGLSGGSGARAFPPGERPALWCGVHPEFRCLAAELLTGLLAAAGEGLWAYSNERLLPVKTRGALIDEWARDPQSRKEVEAAIRDIRRGLEGTASFGTAKETRWRWPALVKTGTSPDAEEQGTDGWVFVLTPIQKPKTALLLYRPKSRGKDAWASAVDALALLHP